MILGFKIDTFSNALNNGLTVKLLQVFGFLANLLYSDHAKEGLYKTSHPKRWKRW